MIGELRIIARMSSAEAGDEEGAIMESLGG
jgi:hypothetical protein